MAIDFAKLHEIKCLFANCKKVQWNLTAGHKIKITAGEKWKFKQKISLLNWMFYDWIYFNRLITTTSKWGLRFSCKPFKKLIHIGLIKIY